MTTLLPSPVVTVAVATYNSADYVEAAVASALGQSVAAIEVIAVDDCSSDDTVDRLRRIAARDARLRVERLPVNSGPAAARNRAMSLARGRWYAVLDSDDIYAPDRLERLLAAATEHKADIVADNLVTFIDGDPASARFHLEPGPGGSAFGIDDYLSQSLIFGRGSDPGFLKPMIDLDRLREHGIAYDERLRIGEDDDLMVRLLMSGFRYRIEPHPTYAYRKHAASISHRLSQDNARAMLCSAAEVARRGADANAAPALEARARAFARALAFTQLIDALKARRLGEFARIGVRDPAALALLRMPLAAAWHRVFLKTKDPPPAPENPAAVAALRQIVG